MDRAQPIYRISAVTHLVSNTYGPRTFGPNWLVPPRTTKLEVVLGPSAQTVCNQFSPHGQIILKNLGPLDKWSPTNLIPPDKWSLEYSVCPDGQAAEIRLYGDQIGWGPFVQRGWIFGDQSLWSKKKVTILMRTFILVNPQLH